MQVRDSKLKLKSKSDLGRNIYRFSTSDGVPSKNGFRDSELVLTDSVDFNRDDSVLVVQSGYGYMPVVIGDLVPDGDVLAAETSDRAIQLTGLNLEKNNVKNVSTCTVAFYNEITRDFDKVVYAPHSYDPVEIVKNRISNLIPLLRENGKLFIAGKKTGGINRYKDHLNNLPGNNQKITQKGKQRVYRYTKTEDFEPEPINIETHFQAEIDELKIDFTACKGLFSPNTLDEGSKLLIENLELSENEKVLDMACGYGAIGIFLKKLYDINLHLSDDNATAVHYSEKNLESNNIQNYELKNKDCLDGFKDQKFDAIVSNPPTHQGRGVTKEMFDEAYSALENGGELYLVYNQNMKYEDQLNQKFSKVEIVEEKDNYAVTRTIK